MRRRNCIMVLVCSRRDTKPWPGFYLRTFTPHHRLFPLRLHLHARLYSSLPSSSCFCFSLPYFIPRFLCYSLAVSISPSPLPRPFFYLCTLLLSFPLPFPRRSSVSRHRRLTVTWHYSLFFFLFLIARRPSNNNFNNREYNRYRILQYDQWLIKYMQRYLSS